MHDNTHGRKITCYNVVLSKKMLIRYIGMFMYYIDEGKNRVITLANFSYGTISKEIKCLQTKEKVHD